MLTGMDGRFEFQRFPGVYRLTASSTSAWPFGASNSLDALNVAKHYAAFDTLVGLYYDVADVNASGVVNVSDALFIMRRFVGLIHSFASGDWMFTSPLVTMLADSVIHQDIGGLVVGDVDGSYTPVKHNGLSLSVEGSIMPDGQGLLVVPVKPDRTVQLAALALDLSYPGDWLEVVDAEISGAQGEQLWLAADGQLRLAWYSLEERIWHSDESMIRIVFRIRNQALSHHGLCRLSLGEMSEAGDLSGRLPSLGLRVPELILPGDGLYLGPNHPNPFTGETEISFGIPMSGKVRLEVMDALGRKMLTLIDMPLEGGQHSATFRCQLCPPGVYYYRLTFGEGDQFRVLTRRMVLSR